MEARGLAKLLRAKSGISLSGYALLVGLVAVTALLALQGAGEGVTSIFCTAADRMERALGGESGTCLASGGGDEDDSGDDDEEGEGGGPPDYSEDPLPPESPVIVVCSADGGEQNANYDYPEVSASALTVLLHTPSTGRDGAARVTVSGTGPSTVITGFEAGTSENNFRNHMCYHPAQPLCQIEGSTVEDVGGSPYTFNNYNCSSPVTCRVTVIATGETRYYVGDTEVGEAHVTSPGYRAAREPDNACESGADFAAGNTLNGRTGSQALPCYIWQDGCAGVGGDGQVVAWGQNSQYTLGDGSNSNRNSPVVVLDTPPGTGSLSNIVQIGAGGPHSCALESNGAVWCWGANAQGQVGDGGNSVRSRPVRTHGVNNVGLLTSTDIAPGENHSCALVGDNVACWGHDGDGQLGNGAAGGTNYPTLVRNPSDTGSLSGIVEVSSGGPNSCAANAAGNVWCWGRNVEGQVGNGTTGSGLHLPVQVSGEGGSGVLAGIRQLYVGEYMSCVRDTTGALCWGWNGNGGIGDNTVTNRSVPTRVKNEAGDGPLTNLQWIAASYLFACAVETGGEVFCWGQNNRGQIGDNTTTDRHLPKRVRNDTDTGYLSGISRVYGGLWQTCVLAGDETVWCWGYNAPGSLGDGTNSESHLPVHVKDVGGSGTLTGVTGLVTNGGSFHALAIR
jgi:alpha-tubulin suppressor-like RCC1 family protein